MTKIVMLRWRSRQWLFMGLLAKCQQQQELNMTKITIRRDAFLN